MFYELLLVLQSVVDVYGAKIKMLDTGDKIQVDQSHLETVIPAVGKQFQIWIIPFRHCDIPLLSMAFKKSF